MVSTTLQIQPEWSLGDLFRNRVESTPHAIAYSHYDSTSESWKDSTWLAIAQEAGRWQQAFLRENLEAGDRIGIMVRNSREWVIIDQAAIGLGLVTVPLYLEDRKSVV